MSKRPDFSDDLIEVGRDVAESVSEMLSLVSGKKTASAPKPAPRPSSPRKRTAPRPRVLRAVSTRLTHATKELLQEAVHRQALAKAAATTEQAIIEEALQQWFKRKGYGPTKVGSQESTADEPKGAE